MSASVQALFATSIVSTSVIANFGGTIAALDPLSPFSVSASVTLNTDGTTTRNGSPSITIDSIGSQWHTNPAAGVGTGIWVRATLSSGTTPSGTLNTWQELSTNRAWSNSRSTAGDTTSTLLLEFSGNSGGTAPLGQATVIIESSATN